MTTPDIHAWADGYGLWHATVWTDGSAGSEGYSRRAARDAILCELAQRERNLDPLRIKVTLVDYDRGHYHYREMDT